MTDAIRKAVIAPDTNVVVNVVEAGPGYDPPGAILVASQTAAIGDVYDPQAGTFAPTPVPLADVKSSKVAAVDARRDALLSGGFTVPAPISAALGDQVLQTRNADDRVNWLTSETLYEKAVAAGDGATLGAKFRNAANATTTVSFTEGLAVLAAMASWGAAILDRSWTLKDAIAAAADLATLDAIDITGGWPA